MLRARMALTAELWKQGICAEVPPSIQQCGGGLRCLVLHGHTGLTVEEVMSDNHAYRSLSDHSKSSPPAFTQGLQSYAVQQQLAVIDDL